VAKMGHANPLELQQTGGSALFLHGYSIRTSINHVTHFTTFFAVKRNPFRRVVDAVPHMRRRSFSVDIPKTPNSRICEVRVPPGSYRLAGPRNVRARVFAVRS
jgi:hypothetical protein